MTNEKQIDEILAEIKTRLMKEIKPEIVNGVWYKYSDNDNRKVNFTDFNHSAGYGISYNVFVTAYWNTDKLLPMTHDEIKDMLAEHAISLGIKEGVTVDRSIFNSPIAIVNNLVTICNNVFLYIMSNDELTINGRRIYEKGIWATVVKEKTSEEWFKKYYKNGLTLKDFMKTNNLEFIQTK